MVLAIIVCFQIFLLRKQKPNTLPFRFQTKVQGGWQVLLRTSGSGALAPTPRARWATGQYSNKLGGQGVLRPTLRASPSSLLLPLLVSPVCQGWREAGAASLLVCVVGVARVSFLVFGLIAALLP